MAELIAAFQAVGAVGFIIILLALISITLLSSLIALMKWVLANTVTVEVHKFLREDVREGLSDIRNDTRLLIDRGPK